MGIVAIGTLHETFVHPMLKRHGELGFHRRVAAVTNLPLHLGEEVFRNWRAMDRVATRAGHTRQGVGRAADVSTRKVAGMAPQARVEHLRGSHFGKGPNGLLFTEFLNVCLSRSVTTLATGPLGRLFAAGDAFVMRVLKEGLPLRRMALLADLPADIFAVGALLSVDGRAKDL